MTLAHGTLRVRYIIVGKQKGCANEGSHIESRIQESPVGPF